MRRMPGDVTPRLKPMPPRRAIDFSVLDIGTSKVVCLIGRLKPVDTGPFLPGRTHRVQVLGMGHHRARGIKAGTVIDMARAEEAIRLAVRLARRGAGGARSGFEFAHHLFQRQEAPIPALSEIKQRSREGEDEFGALPDYINDVESVWNFCKPPIHGWALQRLLERTDAITGR